ncbi:hypothetical protein [Cerasicoccus arenae]|uniref:Uncharacterized protein n=1 Tax=Cerasicoccus arenae TaxID=424488 RepID=A0A8J3DH90_9BACT|nr:hypothetical protein [Cerasicoccus arenae]MBK1858089.1 hypothetical protein [Cerasicoccus arenae]GHC07017.1 hypothetical protein GCM10007047_25120 [Cerasicoccus arenae]
MTPWISLTESHVDLLLTAAQRESLAARPNQGFDNDLLTLAIAEVTLRMRLAIREQATNQLSASQSALPPETISSSAALCLGALDGKLPGFSLTEAQDTMLELAIDSLVEISTGALPVSTPIDPESAAIVRRTFGLFVSNRRPRAATATRLAGL